VLSSFIEDYICLGVLEKILAVKFVGMGPLNASVGIGKREAMQ
jgi:hypothetical protein